MTAVLPVLRGFIERHIVLLFWLVVSALLLLRVTQTGETAPLLVDTDDAMRMVVVRDFLGGQNWFDHMAYRLDTPFGASMHWSRLVDLPIGALILLFRPLAGDTADAIAACIWPLLLLGVLLALSVRLCTRLVGNAGMLPGLVLPMLAAPVLSEFMPGRIDHHNVQIVLTLALVLLVIEALDKPSRALWAGVVAATSLAIGTETLPLIAAAVLAFGLGWTLLPRLGRAMTLFGLGFAAASVVHLAIALPPSLWLVPACDALSLPYVAAAIGIGAVFAVLPLLPLAARGPLWRLGSGAVLGSLLVVLLLLAFPECLAGPYADLSPWLKQNWLNNITEAKPVWAILTAMPGYAIGVLLPPVAGLAVIAYALPRIPRAQRPAWLVIGLFLALTLLVTLLQIRGGRLAALLAVPAGAWLIVHARERYLASQKLLPALGLVGAWLLFAGMAQAAALGVIWPSASDTPAASMAASGTSSPAKITDCLAPRAFSDLAALPPARIMAPIDLGAHLLLETPHEVVAAPYHRAQQAITDSLMFFNGPIEAGRDILEARGISLVVTCPPMPEMGGFADADDTSFVRLVKRDALPDWLDDVTPPGSVLRVYAVTPRAP